jgi:peptide-methionine (S)-S-oxide reductase
MIKETITLGGGCFWCIENIFKRLKGVLTVTSGYAGGDNSDPTYEQVCSGSTNHAEVVQIEFDNEVIPLTTILTVFFAIHDPTTPNRQGDDIGSQYRSIILYRNSQQKTQALAKIAQLNDSNEFTNPIVTEVRPFEAFYSAESYHQNYFENNPENQYCQLVVSKKIQKFLHNFSHLLAS